MESFSISAFSKSNHYFISKLLTLASNFLTFSVHLFINIKRHIYQQDFGRHAHIRLFFSLLRNKLVFFGTITGRKINGLHSIFGFLLPEMSEQSASYFYFIIQQVEYDS